MSDHRVASRLASRYLPPGWLSPAAAAAPADEAALDRHLDDMAIFYGCSCAVVLNLMHLLFWPTDRLLLPADPEVHRVMDWFRCTTFVNHALFLLAMLFRGLRRFPQQILSLSILISSCLFGSAMARLGGLEQPYFYLTFLAPMGISAMPARPLRRLWLSPTCGAAVCLAYFLARPDQLASTHLGSALGCMAFAVFISLAIGHGMFLLTRRAFLSERALARSQATIKEYSEHLEDRVADDAQQLRLLAAHLSRAAEEERARLARELHDEIGQQLTALRYTAAAARQHLPEEPDGAAAQLGRLEEGLGQLATELRHLVTDLRPRILDERGLGPALRWLVERTAERPGLTCTLSEQAASAAVPQDQAVAVFRIVQEALTNALRHSRASAIRVTLAIGADGIRASVTDNGCGMGSVEARSAAVSDREARSAAVINLNRAGMGLFGMSERARALGGLLEIESQPGAGTAVLLHLPLDPGPVKNRSQE